MASSPILESKLRVFQLSSSRQKTLRNTANVRKTLTFITPASLIGGII